MKFLHLQYLPIILILLALIVVFFRRKEKKYFQLIEEYWFFKRSQFSRLSSVLYFLAMGMLLLSLLDFRGKEDQIQGEIPDQKTIVVIDASASMLAEDIRPNRFQKSLILARHFAKNAVGHQVAVILFSNTHKRLVPFTDDVDLLDARIDALKDTDIRYGGSNISLAIKESLQYFREVDQKAEDIQGNILVFTDSEENEAGVELGIPDGVNLAVVGIGTVQGSAIPLRDKNGNFQGYKKYKGEKVISKFSENTLKEWSKKVKHFKYWVALSYTVPTEEIIDFFRGRFKTKLSKGNVRIRPVLSRYLLIPFVILYFLSVVIRTRRSFISMFVLGVLFLQYPPVVNAQEDAEDKKRAEIQEKLGDDLEKLKRNELGFKEKLKLAEKFLTLGGDKESLTLYEETLNKKKKVDTGTLFNYGTALLKNGRTKEAVDIFKGLKEIEKNEELHKAINKNILLALQQQKQEQRQKQQQKKDQEKEDQKDKNKDQKQQQDQQQEKQGQDQKEKKDEQGKGQQDKKNQDQKGEKEKKQNKDQKGEKKEEEQKNKEDESQKKKEQKSKSLEEKEEEIRKKRKMVKVPAMLKQLLNNDRAIQKKKQKTSTKFRKNGPQKDW